MARIVSPRIYVGGIKSVLTCAYMDDYALSSIVVSVCVYSALWSVSQDLMQEPLH